MSELIRVEKTMNKLDIFAIAFGAMIGWGWVVLAGNWIQGAGTFGAMIAFVFGGVMVLFVGLAYSELTCAMPENGGVQMFCNRGIGKGAAFAATWGIILSYISVVAFEGIAFSNVLNYIWPDVMQQGYLYEVAGSKVYLPWVISAVLGTLAVAYINYIGTKSAAILNTIMTVMIIAVGIALMAGSAVTGKPDNLNPFFVDGIGGVMSIAIMTPFMFVGFDVVPQSAGEINLAPQKIGSIMLLSIAVAVTWYVIVIFSVSYCMSGGQLLSSQSTTGLVTADAMGLAFNSQMASRVLIMGGLAGIISSWNSFFMGGSRALRELANSKMLPEFLSKLSPKTKTPVNAIILITIISCLAPFFGRATLIWITNAGSLGTVVAYLLVSMSFVFLRKNEPDMLRPYKVSAGAFVGPMSVLMCILMFILYIPGMPSGLSTPELVIIGVWVLLGAVLTLSANSKYGDEYGTAPHLLMPIKYR